MLKADRQMKILDLLKQESGSLRISELSRRLAVAPVTIRRNIAELARHGMVLSTRGGVRLLGSGTAYEPVYDAKLGEESTQKAAIAQAAAALIPDGATVFLDGGTTVGAVAKHLVHRHVTVITNALNVANVLTVSRTCRLILIGGTFRAASRTFLGPKATAAVREMRFDIACIGTEGFAPDRGTEVPDESDADFKAAAIGLAAHVLLLATSSKLGERRLYRFATWPKIHRLVTDAGLPPHSRNEILAQGVSLTIAGEPNDPAQPI